jgi:hypothetical protein
VITVDMLPPDEKTLKTYGSDENPDVYKVKLEINGYQYQYSRNCLQTNDGNGVSFSETGLMSVSPPPIGVGHPFLPTLIMMGKKTCLYRVVLSNDRSTWIMSGLYLI